MSAPVYGVSTPADVPLSAATAKTVLTVKAHAASGLEVVGFDISFLGVLATDVPALVEVCQWSGATAGTATGAATITQEGGLTLAAGFTANYGYTAGNEPTVLAPFKPFNLTPNGGLVFYDYPLGNEPQCGFSPLGFALRVTSPNAQSLGCRATMRVRRI